MHEAKPKKRMRSPEQNILRFLVGACILCIFGYIIAGESFWMILLCSVVLTFGLAAILWIFLAYGIGCVVLSGFDPPAEPAQEEGGPTPTFAGKIQEDRIVTRSLPPDYTLKPVLAPEEQEMLTFMNDAKDRGWQEDDIKRKLREIGWDETKIAKIWNLWSDRNVLK